MEPTKLLLLIVSVTRDERLPMDEGRLPDMPFKLKVIEIMSVPWQVTPVHDKHTLECGTPFVHRQPVNPAMVHRLVDAHKSHIAISVVVDALAV